MTIRHGRLWPPWSEPVKSQLRLPSAIPQAFCPCQSGITDSLSLAPALRVDTLRYHDSEQPGPGDVVHVDDGSGFVTMVPAWMLDPAVCVGMKLGGPRVSVAALRELHRRLVERGLRRKSSNDVIADKVGVHPAAATMRCGVRPRRPMN